MDVCLLNAQCECWTWRTFACAHRWKPCSAVPEYVLFHTILISLFQLSQCSPPSLPLLSSSPPSLSPQLFPPLRRYPLTYFSLCQTHFPPIPYQQPFLPLPSHSLCLPLYKWWEAGVVFSAHLFISSPLRCCLCVEIVRVQRESVVLAGACEMGIMYLRMPGDVHYANGEKILNECK